jgi:hypothetical protein
MYEFIKMSLCKTDLNILKDVIVDSQKKNCGEVIISNNMSKKTNILSFSNNNGIIKLEDKLEIKLSSNNLLLLLNILFEKEIELKSIYGKN